MRNKTAIRLSTTLLALALSSPLSARDQSPASKTPSLSELAAAADLVAVAQVRDTDYRRRRDIPVSGSAYLAILIPYKTDRPSDLVEVYEKGLHEAECYFPNPSVVEEGRRYLLFLKRDMEDPERYRGLPQGCALEVLVDGNNRYAVRYPADGIRFRDDLTGLAAPMTFSDGYSVVLDEDLPPEAREAMLNAGQIIAHGDNAWQYTTGIELGALRALIGREALED